MYTIQLTQAGVSPAGIITLGSPATLTVEYSYLVGDVYPYTSDVAPNFGSGALEIQDLVQILFAVNSVPGFRPAACSDRFDAMDTYPVDTATARGGDGILDVQDIDVELFRVNNLDTSRPVRSSRGGVCPATVNSSMASPAITATSDARPSGPVEASLVLGSPEKSGEGEERIPVYLEARADLVHIEITFAVGDGQSYLRFVAADASPSLARGELGVVAVAWVEGLSVRPADRLLLGYVYGPAGVSTNLTVYGLSARSLDNHRAIPLSTSTALGANR
jgi:hypothetical protein